MNKSTLIGTYRRFWKGEVKVSRDTNIGIFFISFPKTPVYLLTRPI